MLVFILLTHLPIARESWEVYDRVIFRTVTIHQAQRFGFGHEKTTRQERTMIFQQRLRFGNWETTEERHVDKFPEYYQHGRELRFLWLQTSWDEDGNDYSVWRRCHAKELILHEQTVYLPPD